jgi:hypothetical protein
VVAVVRAAVGAVVLLPIFSFQMSEITKYQNGCFVGTTKATEEVYTVMLKNYKVLVEKGSLIVVDLHLLCLGREPTNHG